MSIPQTQTPKHANRSEWTIKWYDTFLKYFRKGSIMMMIVAVITETMLAIGKKEAVNVHA